MQQQNVARAGFGFERLDKAEADRQRLRLRRLGMAGASYLVTLTIVAFCWYREIIPVRVLVEYIAFCVVVNLTFFLVIVSNLNLRLRDPSLTLIQMTMSIVPSLWVMYFLDPGQGRAVFLLLSIVPFLYGILALNTRQFLLVGGLFLVGYLGLLGLLLWNRPHVLDGGLELIQLVAFTLVTAQIALIGGYINGLRQKLRQRNMKLADTMDELNAAFAEITELASRDSLTGVFNRRRLFDVLTEEVNRCSRADGPFSVCILDIDHFKQVNDEYGHQAGDAVLQTLATEVGSHLRAIDSFGRYGGEEFLLVLPQTPLDGAKIKAERVRRQVEAIALSEVGGGLSVTVSIGVAEYQPGEDIDATIHRADSALYCAKANGRNQVVAEDSEVFRDSGSDLLQTGALPDPGQM